MTTQEAQKEVEALTAVIHSNNKRAEDLLGAEDYVGVLTVLEDNAKLIAEAHVLARVMLGLPTIH